MFSKPSVIQIQGENVSYGAKGAYVRHTLVDLGFEDGGLKTRDAFIADAGQAKGAIVVLADAYHLHEDSALAQALSESHVLVAPSVLREVEAVHAQSAGVTVLLPSSQQKGLEAYVADGTVLPVDKIPAAPASDALAKLEQAENGRAAIAAMRHIVQDYPRHSFIYPPGHFSDEGGGGKERLTEGDIAKMADLIETESNRGGVLVICGGRVDAVVVDRLKNQFAKNANVAVVSQNNQAADLPSAYTQIARDAGKPPQKMLIDALAATTLEVVVESAGFAGADGLSLMTSEKMIGNARREKQTIDHSRAFHAERLVSLGMPFTASMPCEPVPSAPDLKSALQSWVAAKRLNAERSPASDARLTGKVDNEKRLGI